MAHPHQRTPNRPKDHRGFMFTLLFVFAAFLVVRPFSPGVKQARRMELARQHIPHVLPLVKADSRFVLVELLEYTGPGEDRELGSLGVFGYVRTENDLDDLRRLIDSTSPPVSLRFSVQASPDNFDALLARQHLTPSTAPATRETQSRR